MPGTVPVITNPTPPGGHLFAAEAGLPGGSTPGQAQVQSSWSFTIGAADGVGALTVGGYQAIAGGVFTPGEADLGYGRLAVTSYDPATGRVGVSFTLTDTTTSAPGPTQKYGDLHVAPIVLTDADGDQATSNLLIQIRDDDRVLAKADTATAPLGGVVSGDVTANDLFSADGFGAVVQVADPALTNIVSISADGTTTVHGLYGTLTIDATGAYSYASDAGAPADVSDRFVYWTTDGDGDRAQGALTIDLTLIDQTLTSGPGDDVLRGGAGTDTFVLAWSQEQAPGELSPFRDGNHPNARASQTAWDQYDRIAASQGFTVADGEYAGHTLWAKAEGSITVFENASGTDVIANFDPAAGDRIRIAGVGDLAAWERHVTATASSDGYDLRYDDAVFAHVTTSAAFGAEWFVS